MHGESKKQIMSTDECRVLLGYQKHQRLIEAEIRRIYHEIDIREIKNLCAIVQFKKVIRLILSNISQKKMFLRSAPMTLKSI
jgi:hypothetical protein